jgi:hypothetical protein
VKKRSVVLALIVVMVGLCGESFAASEYVIANDNSVYNGPKGAVLHTFQGGNDGMDPMTPLFSDAKGNLYGTTPDGGSLFCEGPGCGTIFELVAPSSPFGRWHEEILYAFTGGADGAEPVGGLVSDPDGNLYGTTLRGGDLSNPLCTNGNENVGCGTAFELSPPQSPGGAWTEAVLHTFEENGTDGAYPGSSLVFDGNGNLYGAASGGASNSNCNNSNCGVIFELSPAAGGSWTESIIYSFENGDGYRPEGPLTFDSSGNLYGVDEAGPNDSDGTVFQLVPPLGGGPWTENTLYIFAGLPGGIEPNGGLLLDASGNLFGTTRSGGTNDDGIAYELVAPQSGGAWTEVVLYEFMGGTDTSPSSFVGDPSGILYGTAEGSHENACGEIFELSDSGRGWDFTILHRFSGDTRFDQGCYPQASLVYGKWNALYGTTWHGGAKSCAYSGCGNVFGFLP